MSRLDLLVRHGPLALAVSAACLLGMRPALAADAAAPSTTKTPAKAPAKAADGKAREGSLGRGTSTGALLTREQLRQCMAEQDRLKQEGADALQTQRSLDQERSEIDRLGTEIKADLPGLDRTSQAAVDAFNARVLEREKRVDAYQAATPLFNERVDKLDADKQSFTKDCGDRRYREDDLAAIKAGK